MSGIPQRLLAALPLVALLAAATVFGFAVMHGAPKRPSALIGRPAPPLDLPPLPGSALPAPTPADLVGHISVVNFWASWCPPCRIEHPALMALAKRQDLTLIGVAYKDAPGEASSYLAHMGNPFAHLGLDADGHVAIDWGVSGVPETFVIGPDGRVLAHQEGPLTDEALRRMGLAAK